MFVDNLPEVHDSNEPDFKGQSTIDIHEKPVPQSGGSPQQRSKIRARMFLVVAGTLFVIFVSVQLLIHSPSKDINTASTKRTVAIQLEVLNGTAEPKAAQKLTEALRAGGFDVVDRGNYKASNVLRTTVIARTADMSAAMSVASYLGVDKNHVVKQPDKNLYLDVSVIIGKDMNQLRVFK